MGKNEKCQNMNMKDVEKTGLNVDISMTVIV